MLISILSRRCFGNRLHNPPSQCLRTHTTATNKPGKPYNLLFFGSDLFSIACLEELLRRKDSLIKSVQVVTPPDNLGAKRESLRQVPLKSFCQRSGIVSVDAPPKSLKGWQAPLQPSGAPFDVAAVVSFGYFLPRRIIESFPCGAINVHPSLLPRYRGASPIQYTILNGDKTTGVSIIELSTTSFDSGRVLKQSTMDVPRNIYYDSLHKSLSEQGARDLAETLMDLEYYQKHGWAQDESLVTHAPRFDKRAAHINWAHQTKEQVFALHRAIGSRIPLTTLFRGKLCQLKLIEQPLDTPTEAHVPILSQYKAAKPGTLVYARQQETLYVRCADDWVGVLELHLQGKLNLKAHSFNNGHQIRNGEDQFESLE
ncbi:formyl transferase [Entophlyctis helioformis]|nr:formyl transferase [Entophlyctis helioformis]